ncbi:MAG: type II secretion system protein [Phycisphaerae bacterium]|jgi:prepilin-type N-terminal cleavage/methylation domain-containing protein
MTHERPARSVPSAGGLARFGGRGFTLIEVLVVVAIIALLVAILIPSLTAAKRLARTAACLSNLKQIGASMSAYTTAHRGWLPVGPANRLAVQDLATGLIYRDPRPGEPLEPGFRRVPVASCGWGGKRGTVPHDFDDRPEDMKRPLTDYIYHKAGLDDDMPLFHCPDDVGMRPIDPKYESWISDPAKRGATIYEICGNSYYINPWDFSKPVSSARRFKIPAAMIVAEEAPMLFSMGDEGARWLPKQIMGWHGRFSRHNLLFLDFHAANLYVHPRGNYTDPHRWNGPGWFAPNYFEIMDFYR